MERTDTSSDTTPKTSKRLGLSRHGGRNNSKTIPIYPTTPDSSVTSVTCKDEVTPTEAIEPKTILHSYTTTPVSSVTSFKRKDEVTPTEPKQPNGKVSHSAKQTMSRHKLSLCKETNETMTRKRVLSKQANFLIEPKRLKLEQCSEHLSAHVEEPKSIARIGSCDIKPTSDAKSEEIKSESLPETKALQNKIDEIKKKIATIKSCQHRTSEMQALQAQWQEAGLKTIEEIQEHYLYMNDVTEILAHYNIHPGLFKLSLTE